VQGNVRIYNMTRCLRCGEETGKEKKENPKNKREELYRFCDNCLDEIEEMEKGLALDMLYGRT